MKRAELVQVLLVAAAPVLFVAQHNAEQLELVQVGGALLAALVAAALLALLLRAVLRDSARAALLASVALVLFFLYGHAFDQIIAGLGRFSVKARYDVTHAVLAAACLLLLLASAAWIARTRRDLRQANQGILIAAAAMVLMSSIGLAIHGSPPGLSKRVKATRALLKPERDAYVRAAPATAEDPERPDIYEIILDGYARGDVLREVYGFDNEPFLRELERRGFYVARESNANYPLTFLSLSSTLNLRYLDDVAAIIGDSSQTRAPFYEMIRDPLAARFLQARGYRYVHFNTNYGGTEKSYAADTSYHYRSLLLQSEFVDVLVRTTALRLVEPEVAAFHLFMFDKLLEVPAIEGPTFAFCHMMLPHNPYVFDREGNVRHDIPLELQFKEKTGGWDDRQAYLDQMQYLNSRVLAAIDALLAGSRVPPVILLHSDHGSASTYPGDDASAERMSSFALERLPILNAYLVPEQVRARLYPSISPVNTYRVLFSALFGAQFELLPDESFLSWYREPYRWSDVTAVLGARAAGQGRPPGDEIEPEHSVDAAPTRSVPK